MGSVTGLVAEDTSSDTITFEDEAFSLGRNKPVKAFRGEGGVGEGACLEMTHGTGFEVSGSPKGWCVTLKHYLPGGPYSSVEVPLLGGRTCLPSQTKGA